MPKFHCIHCGQHIDAPEETAGSQSACPTCGGAIEVPGIPKTHPLPRPVTPGRTTPKRAQAAKTTSKIGSLLGTGLFLLVAIVIGRSCGSIVGRNAAERHLEGKHAVDGVRTDQEAQRILGTHDDSYTNFVQVNKGGLALQVPKEFSSFTTERNSGGDIQSLEKHTSVFTTRSILIKHFILKAPPTVSPSEAADMTEDEIKSQSGYRATRRSVNVSGIEGIVLDAQYSGMGQKVEQSILYLSRGYELWEVHLFGVNDERPEALRRMKDRVFTSIEIKR
jgi:DNA-directed RNA polymerase subunit RPC12/RpoP